MRDTRSIATDGYLSSFKRPRNIAVRGYLAETTLAVIRGGFPFSGGSAPAGETLMERLKREDKELLVIIKKFLEIWL